MKSMRPLACSVGLILVAFAATGITLPRSRTVHLTYQTTVSSWPPGSRQVEVWLPLPHNSPVQQITELTIDSPYPYQVDTAQYGNQVVHMRVTEPPLAGFSVTMKFTATRREHQLQAGYAERSASSDRAHWLQPDRLVPIDGQIRQWAKQVVDSAGARTDVQKAKAIYDHVIATVKYDKTGTGWGRGDIYYACDARRGNCTDFHAIFIGYCRALNIPARFAIGLSLPTDRPDGQIKGYHCWAEFYSKELGWVPIDASEAAKNPGRRSYYFGAHDENRIEFSLGRDLALYPGQAQPLNYFVYPYAEADRKPLPSPTLLVSYTDLPR